MKRKPIQGWMTAALLVSSLLSGTPAYAYSIGEEVKIDATQPEVSKAGFDISDEYAVWILEGEKTITLYDLESNSETKIGDKNSVKTSPHVDGNYVVWIDSRDGNSDVYLYDVSKKKETRVTTDAKATQVEIHGKNIVWADKRDGGSDIYLYNITTGEEQRVSNSGKAENPSVSDTYVVWEDSRNGNADIYYYDMKAKQEKAGVTTSGDQLHPTIYQSTVLFENHYTDYVQISQYTIGKGKDKKLTDSSDDKEWPHLYKDTYVYVEGKDLLLADVDETGSRQIESSIYSQLAPRVYGDYVLYAKADKEKKLRLHLYNIDEKRAESIGAASGEPSQPDGSDRYVVYLTESRTNDRSVVLYDAETLTSQVISTSKHDPVRPLVSNRYVVWYDKSEDALFAYDIRKGSVKQITDEDDDQLPSDELYELDGSNLLWVNVDRRAELFLTDLTTGESEKIASLKNEPLSVDLYDHYVTWVAEQSSKKASVYLYDIDEDDETEIRRDVQVEDAKLGDNFVVWSEYTDTTKPSWDLYYYDIERRKASSLLKWTDRDQVKPQASRNMVLYQDNRLSPNKKDFYYELYDVEDGAFGDLDWSDDAVVEEARIGGNRLVWIDTRDDDPIVYTLAFAQGQDDDDDGSENDGYKDYNLEKSLDDDSLFDIISENDFNKIAFVFHAGTDHEKELYLEVALAHPDQFADLVGEVAFEEIVVRVYK